MLLWLKALHLFFMVAWFAGIFYLPRLFVYHAECEHQPTKDTFKVMERRLWWFVTPFAVLTLIFGIGLIHVYGMAWLAHSHWLHAKLALVLPLYVYHGYLYYLMKQFAADNNTHSPRFYRVLNEVPALALLVIVCLAVLKPI